MAKKAAKKEIHEVDKISEEMSKEVFPENAQVENKVDLDQAKKDYESHPKFSKFNNVEGA